MKKYSTYNRGVSTAVFATIVGVVIAVGAGIGAYYYYANPSSPSISNSVANQNTAPTSVAPTPAVTSNPTPAPTPAPSVATTPVKATVPAVNPTSVATTASPSCSSVLPIATVESAYGGKTVTVTPYQVGGALLANCSYKVTGSFGSVIVKLFDAAQESSYSTTVNQITAEGYKCSSIDSTIGFPASSCGMSVGSTIIAMVVFSTTDGKYAAMISGSGSITPLYTLAKAVNSNI